MSAEKMRKALESIRSALRVDDPHGHYDLVCEALAQADQRGDSVPCAWRAYGARHWNDGPPNQQSIDYYGTNIKYAYTAPPAPVVPEGWKLVLERLTPQMGHTGEATLDDDGSMQEMWTNMLAVAPEVAAKGVQS